MPIYQWVMPVQTCTTATYSTVWIQTTVTNSTCYYSDQTAYSYYAPAPARDVVDRMLQQQRTIRAHPAPARNRARGLLLSHLTAKQRATFKKNKWFVVEGGRTRRRYRVRADLHLIANIEVLEGERVSHRLCAHADVSKFPLGDHLLAQKLMLEHSEDEFLKVANRHAA